MANNNWKQIKKGSVKKFRDFYNANIRRPLSSEDREELSEIFKRKDKAEPSKKIAKPEAEL